MISEIQIRPDVLSVKGQGRSLVLQRHNTCLLVRKTYNKFCLRVEVIRPFVDLSSSAAM